MVREEVYVKLTKIFQDIFDDENLITATDIKDWTSLDQVSILVAIEKYLGIRLNISEIIEVKNMDEMVDIILEKETKG